MKFLLIVCFGKRRTGDHSFNPIEWGELAKGGILMGVLRGLSGLCQSAAAKAQLSSLGFCILHFEICLGHHGFDRIVLLLPVRTFL